MRKTSLTAACACLLAASMLNSSCIGSFQLTNKLLTWNRQIDNKFVNELVFVVFWVLPVYEVSSLADLLVLNSIEFWSGTNPVAKGTKVIKGTDDTYLVHCDGKGYTITSRTDGTSVRLDFDTEHQTWSIVGEDGTRHNFLTFIDDTLVALPGADGVMHTVEASAAGVMAYRAIATSAVLADAR